MTGPYGMRDLIISVDYVKLVNIDLSKFDDPIGRKEIARDLYEAATGYGFLTLTNHGISDETYMRQMQLANATMTLPPPEKEPYEGERYLFHCHIPIMSFGKLYSYPKAPRGGVGAEYLEKFPPGKVPALERPDGYTVFECIAVSYYLAKQNPSTTLLGIRHTPEEEATILSWASFANSELLPPIMSWINPVIGKAPLGPDTLASAEKSLEPILKPISKALQGGKKFLVGDCLTLADLFVVAALARGYQFVLTKKWAATHADIHDYYMAIKNDPIYEEVDGKAYVLDEIAFKS